jgi:hypothetical protein
VPIGKFLRIPYQLPANHFLWWVAMRLDQYPRPREGTSTYWSQ